MKIVKPPSFKMDVAFFLSDRYDKSSSSINMFREICSFSGDCRIFMSTKTLCKNTVCPSFCLRTSTLVSLGLKRSSKSQIGIFFSDWENDKLFFYTSATILILECSTPKLREDLYPYDEWEAQKAN